MSEGVVEGLCTHVPDGQFNENEFTTAGEEDRTCSYLDAEFTPEIEKKYVHRVYDAIAPHFSSTRFAKWPKVSAFLNQLPSGSLVLDAGCGNGKYLGLNPDCVFIGCDISAPLIKICADRGHEVLVADAVKLPYRTGFGDAAISIAVLHHLSTENRRKKAVQELLRVVKKGGLVLITVWAVEQEDKSLLTKWTPLNQKYVEEWIGPGSPHVRSSSSKTLESIPETELNQKYVGEWIGPGSPRVRSPSSVTLESIPETVANDTEGDIEDCNETLSKTLLRTTHLTPQSQHDSPVLEDGSNLTSQQEYFVPWHLPYHRAEVSGASASALANGLAKKDDKKGAVVYNRYYHVFSEGELERLISGMDNAVIIDRFF